MNDQLRILILALAALVALPVSAQSMMIIDGNCQVPLSTSTVAPAVTTDPVTGNVLVTSNGGFDCAGASVSLTAPATVSVGTQFTISWESIGTTGCSMSGGTSGWAGGGRPADGSLLLTAPASTTTVAFHISCATGAAPVTDSVSVEFTAQSSVDLVASASTVPVSTGFSLSWTSTGTTSCTPTGGAGTGWASLGTLPVSGTQPLTAPSTAAANVTFGMTCAISGGGSTSDSELISFTDETDCSNVQLPPGIVSFFQQNWSTVYGADFPLNYSANRTFNIGTGTGLRIAITPTVPGGGTGNGSVTFNEFGNEARAGFMTISPCAGDFRLDQLNVPAGCTANCSNRCHTGAEASSNLNLAFRSTNHAANSCNLTAGRPYFINIHFGSTSTPAADGSYCSGPVCGIIGGTQSLFLRESQALKWLDSGDLVGLSDAPKQLIIKVDPTQAVPN